MRDFNFRSPIARIQLFQLAPPDNGPGDGGLDPRGGAGGISGTPLSATSSVDSSRITPSGGLFEGVLGFLIPVFDIRTRAMKMGTFDFEDFNTEIDCKYKYRQEVFLEGHATTVSRVRIRYRDLGKVSVNFSVLTDEARQPDDSNTLGLIFGGKADGELRFTYFDKVVSGMNPQIYFERLADAGPLCITKVTMITDTEIVEQL